ncbi:MAG: class I SAM-dependent methyltransferase [Synechococcaceae cyanobacterium ELA445]
MKVDAKPVKQCTTKQIAWQWDMVAKSRDDQLRSGLDVSYDQVLSPAILQLIQAKSSHRVLDVGCGSGVLAERIAYLAQSVVGVDPSQKSIALARASTLRPANTEYISESIEAYSDNYQGEFFDIAIANMVLQDAADLTAVLDSVARVLRCDGTFVCTITHPCFWPAYWGYDRCEWFDYGKEIAIDAPFRISSVEEPVGRTTHFHRPLGQYVTAFHDTNFQVDSLVEPFPSRAIQRLYPQPWSFPRFMAVRACRRQR